ncbi:hypothetical protein [uncultured Thiodictyon sp.]|jgi:hypothetical protein|uniref:hypothetical protein n=1 Tax=uncultured Thiodictyon sp. TaxID=1846217 RepID=UPI0025CC1CB9|nr:hypothetical protein [uncultured Thiodictyon sp.]
MHFGVREDPGRYDNLDYDYYYDNDNDNGAQSISLWIIDEPFLSYETHRCERFAP